MRKNERGATLVEMSIVIPLLIVIVMGIADLGRALAAQITLQDAVSEGALFGSQSPDDYTEVRQRVVDAADVPLDPDDIAVECPEPKTIQVTATYEVDMITFVGRWFGSSLTIAPDSVGTVITSSTCQPSPP